MRYWAAWHRVRIGEPITLPLDVEVVVQFVVDHLVRSGDDGSGVWDLPPELDRKLVEMGAKRALGPLKISTIIHRVSVLSKVHQLKNLTINPLRDSRVQTLLMRAKKVAVGRGEGKKQKRAITKTELNLMLDTCDDSLLGIRDAALLLVGWASGGRRRSEIGAIKVEHLRWSQRGFLLDLQRSKTNQDGESPSLPKPITGRAAEALRAWINEAGIESGFLFRRVDSGRVGDGETPISASAIYNIIKSRALKAGLPGIENWSPHSLRSGFVTEAGRRRVPIGDVMAMTEHARVDTVIGYYRAGELEASPIASMLDDAEE